MSGLDFFLLLSAIWIAPSLAAPWREKMAMFALGAAGMFLILDAAKSLLT